MGKPQCFRRLSMYHPDAGKIFGDKFICMDLDVRIKGNIDHILSRDEDFVITKGKGRSNYYNGSMQMMKAGSRPQVYERFTQEEFNRASEYHAGSDQAWIAYALGALEATFTEEEGVYLLYPQELIKTGGKLPDNCRILFVPGANKRNGDNRFVKELLVVDNQFELKKPEIKKTPVLDVNAMIKNPNGWQ